MPSALQRPGAPASHLVTLVFLSRLIPLLAAPITLWLIATQRPLAEQGAYFIFINAQAIAQTVEIGLGALVVQFVSHESAGLTYGTGGALEGDTATMRRIETVLSSASRWYARLAVGFFVTAMPLGLALFMGREGHGWREAAWWITTVTFTALSFTLVPTLAALEGSGRLARVQRMRLVQVGASILALWVGLVAVDALCGVAAFSITWFAVQATWLSRGHRGLVRIAVQRTPNGQTDPTLASLTERLVRAQRHGAVMWLVLWAAPQLLVPIVLLADGPGSAGRIGMSLAIASAPMMLASSWLYSRYPRYGSLVAQGATRELARLAGRATGEAVAVCILGAVAGAVALLLLARIAPSLADRAMSPAVTLALGIGNCGWLVINALTAYARAWRGEPLARATIWGALVVIGATMLVATLRGAAGTIALTYATAVLVGAAPLTMLTFWRSRTDLQR